MRFFSLDVSPGQALMLASTVDETGDEKNTCAVLYSGCVLKSSIICLTLSWEGVIKYTPDRFGSASRLMATFSTTAPTQSWTSWAVQPHAPRSSGNTECHARAAIYRTESDCIAAACKC